MQNIARVGRESCELFHRSYNALFFPGGAEVLDEVKSGEPNAVEAALLFLEADPRHFRSGYIEEYLWRLVPRLSISSHVIERLENVALSYLKRQIGREFWYMCRAMARVGTDRLWREATRHLGAADALVAKRASYLIAYSLGIDAGERVRR